MAQINKIAVMDLTTLVKTPEAMKTTERSVQEENITAEDFDSFISFMNEYGGYLPNETERIYNRTILIYLMKVMRVSGIRLQEARALSRNDITIEEERAAGSDDLSPLFMGGMEHRIHSVAAVTCALNGNCSFDAER